MKQSGWMRCVMLALIGALLCSAGGLRQAGAVDKKQLEKDAQTWFSKMSSADPGDVDGIFIATRELTAMGGDIAEFMIEKLGRMDDISAIGAAFVLGNIDDDRVVPAILKKLQGFVNKGEDDPMANGAGGSMIAMSQNLRDGMLCLSLAMNAARMDKDNPEELKLFTQARDHLRTYLDPANKRKNFVKMAAVMGLGFYLLDEESVGAFCKFALNEKADAILRVAAVLALANFNSDQARDTLEELAKKKVAKDASWKFHYIQKNAALALGNNGDLDSLKVLMDVIVNNKESAGVRNLAWASIGELKDYADHGEIDVLDFLKKQLETERDLKVRTTALFVLYQYGETERALKELEDILYDSKSSDGRLLYASQMVGMILDEKAKDLLLKLLGHPLIGARRFATANLVKFCGDEKVLARLLEIASKDKDSVMKQQAVLGLLRVDPTGERFDVLKACAGSKFDNVKRVTALALANRTSAPEIMALLKKLMADGNLLVADYATLAFGTTGWDADKKDLQFLQMLAASSPYYMVKRDAELSLNAVQEKNSTVVKKSIDEVLARESLVPFRNTIWPGLYTDMINLMLQAAIAETRSGKIDDEEGDEITIEEPSEEFPIGGECAG